METITNYQPRQNRVLIAALTVVIAILAYAAPTTTPPGSTVARTVHAQPALEFFTSWAAPPTGYRPSSNPIAIRMKAAAADPAA